MKKRWITGILAGVLSCAFAVTLAGCSIFQKTADSNFPFDGATQSGYTGSESEWLASQYGSDTHEKELYEEAKAEGYKGTFVEFLKEIGVKDGSVAVNQALASVVSIRTELYTGAGVILSLDKTEGNALIVTNYHVIYSKNAVSQAITVNLYGGEIASRDVPATFVGGAVEYDLALLRVRGSNVLRETENNKVYACPARIGNSDRISAGENVYAIGNPDGEGMSISSGVVSVVAEYIQLARADGAYGKIELLEIRTDAAVNHGNSGGGLFNADGKLVGIVNARSEKEGVRSFGYAIPINLAYAAAQNIADNTVNGTGSVKIARLGVNVAVEDSKGVYNEEEGKYFIEEKIVVNSFESSLTSLGYKAGLRRGDTLLSATIATDAGAETVYISRMHVLKVLLLRMRVGDEMKLNISRGGALQTITVKFDSANHFETVS